MPSPGEATASSSGTPRFPGQPCSVGAGTLRHWVAARLDFNRTLTVCPDGHVCPLGTGTATRALQTPSTGRRRLSERIEGGWLDPSPPRPVPSPPARGCRESRPLERSLLGVQTFSSSGVPLSRAFLILQINSVVN